LLDLVKAASIVSHLGNPVVKSSRCCRVRSRLSGCRACLEVCPAGGIKWTGDDLETANCQGCGLCGAACPTGALSRVPPPMQLAGKAGELAGIYENGYVFCSRHAPRKGFSQGIEVPCLGSISWEEWLALLLLSGTIKIFHPAEGCNRCRVETGGEAWRAQMRKAESLAEKNMPVCTRLNIERKKDRPRHINKERRQLFGALVGGLGKVPENFVSGLLGGARQEQRRVAAAEGMITGRRAVLLDVLQKQPGLPEKIGVKLPHVEGNCRFCEACSILCPQGALKQNRANGVVRLELDGAVCSGCNLCVEVCYHRVMRLAENKAVELGKGARCLVEGREFTCPDCGGIYAAVVEDGSACCKQRRQWAKMPHVIARPLIMKIEAQRHRAPKAQSQET